MAYSLGMEPSDVGSEQVLIKHQLDIQCCVTDLITLPVNYYTQRVWYISKL